VALALFDLDRTLLDVNSGRSWATSQWREGRIGARDLVWAAYWLIRYELGHESGLDAAMEAAARTVVGERESALEERVQRWFDREIRHHLRPGARAALAHHRARGDHLVLATSGTVYAARVAVAAFGLDAPVATTLEVVDGKLTGRFTALAMGEGKTRAVRAYAEARGDSLAEATFYTDSSSDRTLLEAVGHPRVVAPDRALARLAAQRGWPVEDWGLATDPSGG
jgi:HAD superfamily hydrolase (TIGR01490 family)